MTAPPEKPAEGTAGSAGDTVVTIPSFNRFTKTPLKYDLGVTADQVREYNSGGEYNRNRAILIAALNNYWTTFQTYHFSLFVVSVVLIIHEMLLWNELNIDLTLNFFILGCGCSLVQSFFPHAPKTCNENSEMRKGEMCFSHEDCTQSETLTPAQQNSCQAPTSKLYNYVRIVQLLCVIAGGIMVGVDKETERVMANDVFSFCMGFSVFYILTYIF